MINFYNIYYIRNIDAWRLINDYIFLLVGGVVTWNSKKQSMVVLSTIKALYMATTHVTKEVV